VLLGKLDDPIALWQYAERYLGVGTRTYSSFSADLEISADYHPQLGRRSFQVPTFRVCPGEGSYLRGAIDSTLHEAYHDGGSFLLPVHPETLAHPALPQREELLRCESGPVLDVVPSANARTVFVERMDGQPVPPHFLKLHYPKRLSRFTRRLRRPIIELQLWVAAELDRIRAPFLPEVGGGVFGGDPREAWGFLLREASPGPGPSPEFTVPLFALYGRDYLAPDDPTLLEQLIEASGEPAASYVADRVVRPMVRLYLDIMLGAGCAAELHGQNTLYGFSGDGVNSRILYRDCAVYVDPALRASRPAIDHRGLPVINVISRDVDMPADQVFSLAYDSFMGHHALDYIAVLARDRFGVQPRALQGAARAEFAGRAQEAAGLLPETVFYYDGTLYPDGEWRLTDTGEPPRWR
jgi:hypothetical protein